MFGRECAGLITRSVSPRADVTPVISSFLFFNFHFLEYTFKSHVAQLISCFAPVLIQGRFTVWLSSSLPLQSHTYMHSQCNTSEKTLQEKSGVGCQVQDCMGNSCEDFTIQFPCSCSPIWSRDLNTSALLTRHFIVNLMMRKCNKVILFGPDEQKLL